MTAPLLDRSRCVRVGTRRAWHLPRIVLANDETAWELHTWCGTNLTGLEHTETHAVPTCRPCVEAELAHRERSQ